MSPRDPFKTKKVVASQAPVSEVTLFYDYDRLAESAREHAQDIARTIKLAGMRVQSDVLLISSKLVEARDGNLFPAQEWQDWVKTEFGIEPRRAQLLMNVARKYGERVDAPKLLASMGDTVAMMVSQPSIPDAVRITIEEMSLERPMTTRAAKEIIRDLTYKEAVAVVNETLDHLDDEALHEVLSGSTYMLKKHLPDDVALSDSVLTTALMTVRSERVGTLIPPSQQETVEDMLGVNTSRLAAKVVPPDLAAKGWELRRLAANGEFFCINTIINVSTPAFSSWRSAVEASQELEAKRLPPVEVPPSIDVVEVELPRKLAQKLLGVSAAKLPGISEREAQQLRTALSRSLL